MAEKDGHSELASVCLMRDKESLRHLAKADPEDDLITIRLGTHPAGDR